MKITLVNNTHWRNDHIRAFLRRAMKDERPDLCMRGAPALYVEVSYTRTGRPGSSGWAWSKSNRMTVRLPKHGKPDNVDFAFVIARDLACTRGMTSAAMRGNSHYNRRGSWRSIYSWAEHMPLELTPKTVRVPRSPANKLDHAHKMLKTRITRERLAVTLRKKWQKKVRYYEKAGGG